jgi:hypothetical protein
MMAPSDMVEAGWKVLAATVIPAVKVIWRHDRELVALRAAVTAATDSMAAAATAQAAADSQILAQLSEIRAHLLRGA